MEELRRRTEETESSRRDRAATLKDKTRSYVAQLTATHKAAMEEALAKAATAEGEATDARAALTRTSAELEQIQAAATASVLDLRAELVRIWRVPSWSEVLLVCSDV